jgi:methylated-DNA-[protein]-cysteine S-methyltransferase
MRQPAQAVAHYGSPIGLVELRGSEAGLSGLDFVDERISGPGSEASSSSAAESLPSPLAEAMAQLDEYFRGERRDFTVRLDLRGTPFQKRVWSKLLEVRFGRTTTYGALAASLGSPAAARAVGGANHRNPVSIIVPCHRVVGSDGRLTGYGGGLWRKDWLLRHESAISGISVARR